ncbi:ERC protein 2 [Trichoplax sp. H2]|nr:ERC protein 2 [Trichoplax sp. H2]|eukprot:RDD44583.1 ERC protein 2 [Trichoplax sp. H2]
MDNYNSSPYGHGSPSMSQQNNDHGIENSIYSSVSSSGAGKFSPQPIIHNHVNRSSPSPANQHARNYPYEMSTSSASPIQMTENNYGNSTPYMNQNHHPPPPQHNNYSTSPPLSPHHHQHLDQLHNHHNHSIDMINSHANSYHSIYNSTTPSYQSNQYGQLMETLGVLKAENENLRKEIKLKDSKLAATVNSIKTFWSPELKKESMIKREEVEKSELLKDRFKMIMEESQNRAEIIQDLHKELKMQKQINNRLQESQSNERSEELKMLQSDKEQMIKDMLLLSNKLGELENENSKLQEKLELRDVCIENLRHFLDRKVTTFNDAAKVMPKLKQLEVYVAKTDRENMLLEQELKERNSRIDLLQKQIDQLKDQSNGSQNGSQSSNMSDDPSDDKKQVEIFKSHSKFMKAKLEAARAELNQKQAALQSAEAKLEMLSVRESNLSQHITVLQESIKSKKEENSLLQADLEAVQAKIKVIEKENQVQQPQPILVENTSPSFSPEKASEELNVQYRLNHLQMTVKEKDEEIIKLESTIKEKLANVKSITAEKEKIEQEYSNQVTTINRLQAQVQALTEELTRMKQTNSNHFGENKQEIQKSAATILEMENYQQKIKEFQVLIDAKSNRIQELETALEDSKRIRQDHDFEFKSEMESIDKKLQELEYFKKAADEQREQCNKYKEKNFRLENGLDEQEKIHYRLKNELNEQIQLTMKLSQDVLLSNISEKDHKASTLELSSKYQGVDHRPDIELLQNKKQELIEELKLQAQRKMHMMPFKQEEAKKFFIDEYVDYDEAQITKDMDNLKQYGIKLYQYIHTIQHLVKIDPASLHHLPDLQSNYNQLVNSLDNHAIQNLREVRRTVNNLHTVAMLILRQSIDTDLSALEDAPEFPLPE